MAVSIPEKKFYTRLPPRSKKVGAVLATAAGQAFALVDPSTSPATPLAQGSPFIELQADGGDVLVLFAQTQTDAVGINGAAMGPIGTAGVPLRILAGAEPRRFIMEPGVDLWLGYQAAGANCVLRYFVCSVATPDK